MLATSPRQLDTLYRPFMMSDINREFWYIMEHDSEGRQRRDI